MTEDPSLPQTHTESQEGDSAWISADTFFSTEELKRLCADPVRLLRINSMMEFDELRRTGPNAYRIKAKNLSNGKFIDTTFTLTETDDAMTLNFEGGLKTQTVFRIEESKKGALLKVTDDYSGTPIEEREKRLDEVDKSLLVWGDDLFKYFHNWKRWTWLPGWKWYMRRVWQPMKPTSRRIAYMLWMITAFEFAVFLMVLTVFVVERNVTAL